MANSRIARAFLTLIVLPGSLAACASIEASQPRFMDLRRGNVGVSGYRVLDALTRFAAINNAARGHRTPRQYRDDVVRVYLVAIEAQYGEFRTAVESEGREFGLGTDLAMAGFTGWASVARESIVNELSAITSGIGNVQGAFSRNLYGSRTLPAVLASMDAQRLRIITRIEQGLARDERAYPLSAAFVDLAMLESAGSLSRAAENLTGAAVQDRQEAEQDYSQTLRACESTDDLTANRRRIMRFVVANEAQPAALVPMAQAMNIPTAGIETNGNALRTAIQNALLTGYCNNEELGQLITRLRAVPIAIPDQ